MGKLGIAVGCCGLVLTAVACGTTVLVEGGAGHDGGSGGAPSTVSTSPPSTGPVTPDPEDCDNSWDVDCMDDCGNFYSPICVNGSWDCEWPPPTNCTCDSEALYSCDFCDYDSSIECELGDWCVGGCEGVVCTSCESLGDGVEIVGNCQCACNVAGQVACELIEGCCNTSADCSSPEASDCLDGTCVPKLKTGQCWTDEDCPSDDKCIGASICPCAVLCGVGTQPGECQPT